MELVGNDELRLCLSFLPVQFQLLVLTRVNRRFRQLVLDNPKVVVTSTEWATNPPLSARNDTERKETDCDVVTTSDSNTTKGNSVPVSLGRSRESDVGEGSGVVV